MHNRAWAMASTAKSWIVIVLSSSKKNGNNFETSFWGSNRNADNSGRHNHRNRTLANTKQRTDYIYIHIIAKLSVYLIETMTENSWPWMMLVFCCIAKWNQFLYSKFQNDTMGFGCCWAWPALAYWFDSSPTTIQAVQDTFNTLYMYIASFSVWQQLIVVVTHQGFSSALLSYML
jgi:hypothetical protein